LGANKDAATVVITTSKSDKATGQMTSGLLTTGFIGGPGGLSELHNHPEDYKSAIVKLDNDRQDQAKCGPDENGQAKCGPDKKSVSLYDVSAFVNCQVPGTSNGSHSDVYDEQMGNFLGQIIRAATKKN
jgi:hypothetical protein